MIDSPPRAQPRSAAGFDRQKSAILALVALAQLLVIVDATIVNVALPSIQRGLHFSRADLQWVTDAYTLVFGGFLLLGGRAADLLGRRSVLMAGIALFTGASLVCGLAQSSTMLEVARGVQGLGGALSSPAALSILMVTFSEGRERNRALAVWGAVVGGGAATGVVLGGLLAQGPGWRWVFFVNVPVGILALFAAPRLLPESRGEDRSRSYDLPGAISVTVALVLLVYAMVGTTTYGWGSARTIGELIGAAVLFLIFVAIEGRFAGHPLVPLRIFRSWTLSGADVVMLLVGLALFAMFFFLSLYLQEVLHFSPLRAGVAYLPLTTGIIVVSGLASSLVGRTGVKWPLAAGLLGWAAALLLLARVPDHGSYAVDILPAFIVLSIGAALTFLTATNAAVAGVERQDSGLASALLNTSQQVGGAVGLGLLATLATSRTNSVLAGNPAAGLAHALVAGFHLAFLVAAGLAAAAALVALLTISRDVGRIARITAVPAPEPRVAELERCLAACAVTSPIARHAVIVQPVTRVTK